ncbi:MULTISPECIES: hypothetical protein [unclassified Chitinophaga]|uniref:hypothetical protein n=1 Tax=unclassified Chitinophaga TaxID=2619133 RepID=UPI00300FB483
MKDTSLLLLLLFYSSCLVDTGQKQSGFYNDIDLFSLQGKEKLTTKPILPYIEIKENNDSERIVTFHRSKNQVKSTIYKKKADAWCTVYLETSDTTTQTVYEYLQPAKIIKLYYIQASNNQLPLLQEVVVLEKWKETSFLVDNLPISPGVDVAKNVTPNANGTYVETITKLNGTLIIEGTKLDGERKETFHIKKCYEIGGQSYFRWRYLNPQIKPILCDSL